MTSTVDIETDKDSGPFLVEKAVHNIMFIKHHMKRQDEYDAVSDLIQYEGKLTLCFKQMI